MNGENELAPQEMLEYLARSMGMKRDNSQPEACGKRYVGDGVVTKGYLWFYAHENYFAVTKCNFVFCSDRTLGMPFPFQYLALRLDHGNHLPPGKIISFMEEKGDAVSAPMKRGSRIAYTEIMYLPVFYRKHLDACFPVLYENPVDILQNMGGEHNWTAEMFRILADIQACDTATPFTSLYYVGKAYELMSELLAMGAVRAPRNKADYNRILAVISHIDRHLFETITQKDLLVIASMSPTKLKMLFRQFTGLSITDYISEKKTNFAEHLLAATDQSVEQIAAQTGFETASGFATFFKKHRGMTPTLYRKQMKFYCMQNPSESKVFVLPEPTK